MLGYTAAKLRTRGSGWATLVPARLTIMDGFVLLFVVFLLLFLLVFLLGRSKHRLYGLLLTQKQSEITPCSRRAEHLGFTNKAC